MTKNWPDFIQLPETVDEAVHRLMVVLEDEHKAVVASLREEDLIDLHFDLGLAIRNAFGLHRSNNRLLTDCSVTQPDDAAGVIIRALWKQLNSIAH